MPLARGVPGRRQGKSSKDMLGTAWRSDMARPPSDRTTSLDDVSLDTARLRMGTKVAVKSPAIVLATSPLDAGMSTPLAEDAMTITSTQM